MAHSPSPEVLITDADAAMLLDIAEATLVAALSGTTPTLPEATDYCVCFGGLAAGEVGVREKIGTQPRSVVRTREPDSRQESLNARRHCRTLGQSLAGAQESQGLPDAGGLGELNPARHDLQARGRCCSCWSPRAAPLSFSSTSTCPGATTDIVGSSTQGPSWPSLTRSDRPFWRSSHFVRTPGWCGPKTAIRRTPGQAPMSTYWDGPDCIAVAGP